MVKNKNNTRVLSIAIFIMAWQTLAIILHTEVLPSFIDVLISLYSHCFDGELFYHLSITLQRVFIAFIIAMTIGVFFGILMGRDEKLNSFLDSLLIFGLNLPALVSIILCYIWFGLTDFAAILAVIINKVPNIIVIIREGAKAVDNKFMQIAKVYKVNKKDTFLKIYLPQMYPYIIASARNGLSLIWKIVLVVELLGRSDGVGFQLAMFFQFFDITSILAYSGAFMIVMLFIENFILRPIEAKSSEWR
ncbi:MAG: ABC transporter permease subunit [Arcobacter sp.]|nr:ABC transporter permease subunit [Arcobacter sp.]